MPTDSEPSLDVDVAWLARLKEIFSRWNAWAVESNACQSAQFRQIFADRLIELTLAERIIDEARVNNTRLGAQQARAWTLRCIERLSIAVAQSQGVDDWMHEGLCFLKSGRGEPYVTQL